MARRARIHSRDIQPQVAAPKGLFAAARVQRFDWPMNIPTTYVDELARRLHVGSTREIPEVTVTMEAFDVSHATYAYLTGYTPHTFPVSGASITEFKNIDVIGQIRDGSTQNIVNALYVRRGIVTGMDASFDVRNNSTVSYTITSNQKKEFKQPVYYQSSTTISGGAKMTLSNTPTYLTRTSGYIINAFRQASDGSYNWLDEGASKDFTVTGSSITFLDNGNVSSGSTGNADTVWVTYCAPASKQFEGLDDVAPAAIQGKYVPLTISVSSIPRVQSATIRASFTSESIVEMGGLGKPVGVEIGLPDVTGDITVLKTDNELLDILEGTTSFSPTENDIEYALDSLPLKVELKDPDNPNRVVLTYYVPSITINSEGDSSTVNQSVEETFSWTSTTGELYVLSGSGVY